MIDLAPEYLEKVRTILRQHVPQCEVRAFGSRVTWTAKDYSDLDLAVVCSGKLSDETFSRLKEAFEESDLPFRVDVLDWHSISPEFQKVIEKQYEVVEGTTNGGRSVAPGLSPAHAALKDGATSSRRACGQREGAGGMAGEWPKLSLREANVTLIDCDHRTPPASDSGFPYVAIPQLRNGRIDVSTARRISREHYIDWTRKAQPRADDVVLSRRCNPGETAFVSPKLEFAVGQNLVLLRADGTKVYPPFLRWLVRGPEWWEQIGKFLNVGAVFDSLRCADVPNFELHVPPLEEQKAIAHILGTLDDKIELNRRMNETLEAMARALFKSWFVDFDPVRAKAEGRDPGLPKHLADRFPDSFEGSALGDIPVGWKVRSLSEVTTLITKGTTPTQNELGNAPTSDSQVAYLRVNAIAEDGSILHDKLTRIPDTVHKGTLKRSILQTNDVAYTIAGTIGRIAVIEDGLLPANTNQAVAIIRPKAGMIPPTFLVLTMRQPAFQEELHSNIVHAVQANLSLGMLSRAKAVFPPLESVEEMFRPIGDILRKISINRGECRTLAALRDTLLPKLISGEIRIKDAERIAGVG